MMADRQVISLEAERLRVAARRLMGVASAQQVHAARMLELAERLETLVTEPIDDVAPSD
jgi:hypothetical protein